MVRFFGKILCDGRHEPAFLPPSGSGGPGDAAGARGASRPRDGAARYNPAAFGSGCVPNLLAHFGVQGVVGRAIVPRADLRWILLGALLPDAGWILHRLLRQILETDPYRLRAYAIVQASLFLCLLLAAGLALLSRAPLRAFGVLASGSLLHLLLDASQIKWGNGVHLLAPFSWELWNAGAYWPESPITVGLTLFGAAWLVWAWRRSPGEPIAVLPAPGPARLAGALLCLAAYLALPLAFTDALERSDSHFVATLRHREERAGKPVAFDRVWYRRDAAGGVIESWSGEQLTVAGRGPARSGLVSLRARFRGPDTLEVERVHVHAGRARDYPSYLGLLLLIAAWIAPFGGRQHTGNGAPS